MRDANQDRRIDWIGGFIVTAGLCLFCFSLTESGIAERGWSTPCELTVVCLCSITADLVRCPRSSSSLDSAPRCVWFLGTTPRAQHYLPTYCQVLPVHSTRLQGYHHRSFHFLHRHVGIWVYLPRYHLLSNVPRHVSIAMCHQDIAMHHCRYHGCRKSTSPSTFIVRTIIDLACRVVSCGSDRSTRHPS